MTVLGQTARFPVLSAGTLQGYLDSIQQISVLTAEEETELFQRFQVNEDLDAARELVMCHLRYVAYIARGYRGYGLPLEDLIQQGNVGLMKSVKKFDLSHGVRLVSFAVHWIKAEIHEYVLKNWKIVKVATTKAQRKLFFNLRKAKARLGWFNSDEVNQVASVSSRKKFWKWNQGSLTLMRVLNRLRLMTMMNLIIARQVICLMVKQKTPLLWYPKKSKQPSLRVVWKLRLNPLMKDPAILLRLAGYGEKKPV